MGAMLRLIAVFVVLLAAGALVWFACGSVARNWLAGPASGTEAAANEKTPDIDLRMPIADAGLKLAMPFTTTVRNPQSLAEMRAAIDGRGRRALSAYSNELGRIQLSPNSSTDEISRAAYLERDIGVLWTHEGEFGKATVALERALALGRSAGMPPREQHHLTALLGIVALRRGEVENCIECVGPSSCIFPISADAVHAQGDGSRRAVEHFTAYLNSCPDDLRIRWLLNLAHMTLGEYPQKVPPKQFLPLDAFRSTADVGRFVNVAAKVGLNSRGPNLAGGSVFDDFTGDGLPDLFTTSLDTHRGASLYVNRGDGTFEDRSKAAGLDDQIYALNLAHADFDNDGNLDVVLLRGGWENPLRLSLLRNRGKGVFEDVTLAAGLGEPIATEAAAWGDYDNDGLVDLFVCGEYFSPVDLVTEMPDPRNHCRLYRNLGGGKFVDVADASGVVNKQCAKGCAWGDFDGDGRLDLFVSNRTGPSRLYRNEGNGRFRDVAREVGVAQAHRGFAAWFWDYDNDGLLDLYVNNFEASLADFVEAVAGGPTKGKSVPKLYRNLGARGFRDVAREVGLDRPIMSMGCNCADVDNDGYLDIYLATGNMLLEYLIPNLMFKNVGGTRFADVTMAAGVGHLQKGHGVSFADWDCDGDLDCFVEVGGAVPGDRSYNLLFDNPTTRNHWLKVKLVGVKTNRAALGARVRATIRGADGAQRSIYRTVGNNSSFGGNCLVVLLGLADALSVAELAVAWPTSGTTQTFRNLAADQAIEITEGVNHLRQLPQTPLPKPSRR